MDYILYPNIICCKEPTLTINKNDYGTNEEKANLISKETGIPIKYIFDKSSVFLYQSKMYYYDQTENWFKKDDIWYYVKRPHDNFNFFNQLLGEQIALYFGLRSAEYRIVKFEDENYDTYKLASKNFCNPNYDYFTHDDIDICKDRKNLTQILEDIKKICSQNNDHDLKLLNDIILMSIRDLYDINIDRHKLNFFYEKNNQNIRLAPLFDYEDCAFSYKELVYNNAIWKLNLSDKNVINILRKETLFKEAIIKLLNIDIKYLLSLTQEIHGIEISKSLTDHYLKKDKQVKKLVMKTKF